MVIERRQWVRGLLVAQPAIAWPCSWWAWSGGSAIGLALAVVLLWAGALLCVFAIVVPLRREQESAGSGHISCPGRQRVGTVAR